MIFKRTKNIYLSDNIIKVPNDMSWCFEDGQYYERNLTYWLKVFFQNIEDCSFFDIGANYGYYTVLASSHCRCVTAFEPVAETFFWLRKNVESNSLSNVSLNNFGLSDSKSAPTINIYSSSGNNSLFDRSIPEGHSLRLKKQEKIKLFDLDSLIGNDIPENPDLMKVDVEGGELHVLQGALKIISACHPVIIMESSDETCRDAGYSVKDLLELLESLNYKIFGLSADVNDNIAHPTKFFSELDIANIIALPNDMELPAERDM